MPGRIAMNGRMLIIFAVLIMVAVPVSAKRIDAMNIRISSGDTVLTATMLDNATSRDFMSMLPLTLSIRDYAGTEKISDLPRELSTIGAPPGVDPSVGDITLYSPWGNLAIFYRDFGYARGLILLGRIDSGIDRLSRLSGDVTFERVK